MQHMGIGKVVIGISYCPGGCRGRFHVIGTVHDQVVTGRGMRCQGCLGFTQLDGKSFQVISRQRCAVAVALTQMCHEDPRSIRCLPPEFTRLIADTAPDAGRLEVKTAQYLRNLSGVSKWIGNISNRHARTKAAGGASSLQQVADVSFWSDQEHIRQDVPWTDQDAAALHMPAQRFILLRTHEQVIIQDNGLTIQHKVFELGIVIQDLQQVVHQVNELQAELLECEIPFTIPVGV